VWAVATVTQVGEPCSTIPPAVYVLTFSPIPPDGRRSWWAGQEGGRSTTRQLPALRLARVSSSETTGSLVRLSFSPTAPADRGGEHRGGATNDLRFIETATGKPLYRPYPGGQRVRQWPSVRRAILPCGHARRGATSGVNCDAILASAAGARWAAPVNLVTIIPTAGRSPRSVLMRSNYPLVRLGTVFPRRRREHRSRWCGALRTITGMDWTRNGNGGGASTARRC